MKSYKIDYWDRHPTMLPLFKTIEAESEQNARDKFYALYPDFKICNILLNPCIYKKMMENVNLESRKELTDEVLANYTSLNKKQIVLKGWHNEGDIAIIWINEKGNFNISKNENNSWDVYFALEFTPNRIKNNLMYLDELEALYLLLTDETI